MAKKTTSPFGTVLSYIVLIITIIYWVLLFVSFVWDKAYTDFYWFFTFGQYGLTIIITALIMLATIPIACRSVTRPLSAMLRLFAPFSAFCLFQAMSGITRLISPDSTVRNVISWICFALIVAILVITLIIIRKFKNIPEKKERALFEKRKKIFFIVLAAEFILSFFYICILCTILPREISLFLRYSA